MIGDAAATWDVAKQLRDSELPTSRLVASVAASGFLGRQIERTAFFVKHEDPRGAAFFVQDEDLQRCHGRPQGPETM